MDNAREQPDAKDEKQFWKKIWEEKEYNRNAELMNNTKKELQGLEEGPNTPGISQSIIQECPEFENPRT